MPLDVLGRTRATLSGSAGEDQPGSLYATGARFRNSLAVQLFVFHIPNTQSLASKSISADASVAFHGPTTTHKNIQPPRGRAAKIGNLAVLSLAVNKTEPSTFPSALHHHC